MLLLEARFLVGNYLVLFSSLTLQYYLLYKSITFTSHSILNSQVCTVFVSFSPKSRQGIALEPRSNIEVSHHALYLYQTVPG